MSAKVPGATAVCYIHDPSNYSNSTIRNSQRKVSIFLRLFSHPKTFWKFDSTQIVENEFQSTPTGRALETSYKLHIVLLTRRK